ncbi:hypothetical protein IFR05_016536 [Cadophora sp. M221]|nr:hypothetical protein IFR05_016536 [Cadophora sp. M221]
MLTWALFKAGLFFAASIAAAFTAGWRTQVVQPGSGASPNEIGLAVYMIIENWRATHRKFLQSWKAYIVAVAYNQPLELGLKLQFMWSSIFLLWLPDTLFVVRQIGWSIRVCRIGRQICEKALKSEWNLGKGYEGSDEQLMCWVEKLLQEDTDSEITARQRYEKIILPIIRTINWQLHYDEDRDPLCKLDCPPKAFEAGVWRPSDLGAASVDLWK